MIPIDPHPRATLGEGAVVYAFDVGGTDTKSAIIDSHGRVLGVRRTPTPSHPDRPADAIVNAATSLATTLSATHPELNPTAVGLAVPGLVDSARGIGIYSNNLRWRDAPLRESAARSLGLPVTLHHDVTAAGIAEHRLGAARGLSDTVVLIIGTGIAGTLILNGRLYLAGGFAGEIGHTPVAEEPACTCGGYGCLEAVASAAAIVRRYEQRTGVALPGASAAIALAAAGDPAATMVWDQALDALAFTIAQLASTIAPQAIVIGGGLSLAGSDLFEPLTARVDARLTYQRRPQLIPAALGGDAGLLGAALAAREEVGE